MTDFDRLWTWREDFDSALIARLRDRIAELKEALTLDLDVASNRAQARRVLDGEPVTTLEQAFDWAEGQRGAAEAERDALRRVGQKLADGLRFRSDGVAHEALEEWRKLVEEAQP